MDDIIKVRNLCKNFNDLKAVDDLSFTVSKGQVYGFLGQNGAGKSTTIRMLLTLITASQGSIEIFGLDLQKHRKEILRNMGAIIERPDLYNYLTAIENLRIFAKMSGLRPSTTHLMEQLSQVGLADRAHSKVKTYSQGMKQRLGLAVALVHDPALIILDEPTNGLDPQGIAEVRQFIIRLGKEMNKTVLVSSHILSEVELMADAMLILHNGKKVADGSLASLFNPAETVVTIKTVNNDVAKERILQSSLGSNFYVQRIDSILLKMHEQEVPACMQDLMQLNIGLLSFQAKHSLEDYFLSLTTPVNHVDLIEN